MTTPIRLCPKFAGTLTQSAPCDFLGWFLNATGLVCVILRDWSGFVFAVPADTCTPEVAP